MANRGTPALQADPDVGPSAAVPFQFEVSWRSLTHAEEPSAAHTPEAGIPAETPPPRDITAGAEARAWESNPAHGVEPAPWALPQWLPKRSWTPWIAVTLTAAGLAMAVSSLGLRGD